MANYLHFSDFGLYEDDWFFEAFPFVVSAKDWMFGSLADQFRGTAFQGRPLQTIFGYTFAEIGARSGRLDLDYLIAYLLFATSALLMFAVVRRRFSTLVATLAALLFVLTPLHTLHQFLNGQFSFGPAFSLLFLGILLYQRGRNIPAYILALLSLFCYESIFMLFVGAPLLCPGKMFSGRGREWLRHLGLMAAVVALYFLGRQWLGESRVAGTPMDSALLGVVAHTMVFQSLASFATYLYGILRVPEAQVEGWFYAGLFAIALAQFFRADLRASRATAEEQSWAAETIRDAAVGMVFVLLGFALGYFVLREAEPHFHATDRDTRISAASSFGSSIVMAVLLGGVIRARRSKAWKVAAYSGTAVFVCLMFLYSFVLQQDYVEDWQEQRTVAAQMMTLTPDVTPDSLIVLKENVPGIPFFTTGRRRRAIGLETGLYEGHFTHLFGRQGAWPKLFMVHSDEWAKHLELTPEGRLKWDAPVFHGRWYPASTDERYHPGRFIVLEEVEPGRVVRRADPILVAGQQIVQMPPAAAVSRPTLWNSIRLSGLTEEFLPVYSWRAGLP